MKKFTTGLFLILIFTLNVYAGSISLGSASSFAVLAGSTVTNTGLTLINGNVGVAPGTAITGFPPGVIVNGTQHSDDAAAVQAQIDLTTAYNIAAGQACGTDLTGDDLGDRILTSGVYCFRTTSAQLTGMITLDAQNNANAVFVIQIGTTLTTASLSDVNLINGALGSEVFWQVGTSATLGTGTTFEGNILADSSITLTTGADILNGRALAINGAVTLDTNDISASPEPATSALLCLILLPGFAILRSRSRRASL